MFETAKWIENPDCPDVCAPIFRKTFSMEPGCHTEIAVCGLGFYVLEINGNRVTQDFLTPPFTAYDKRVLYQVYDITEYVVSGENKIEVICGNGWYNQQEPDGWSFHCAAWKSHPKMICQVDVNESCFLVSDSSWETAESRTIFNSHRTGETYQASKELQGFHPASIARGPGGTLHRQTMPAVKLQGTYTGKEIYPHIYDFGKSITGNVEIIVEGPCGEGVTIEYSERLRDDGTLDRENIREHVYSKRFAEDIYLLKGEEKEKWHGDFSFHGFRYVRLYYAPCTKIFSVTARDIHTDLQSIGGYTCDYAPVNHLHNACVRSLLTNYVHIPMDCPHREKNGWTADAMMSSFQALYNLDMKESYIKWLDDIADCQRPNGAIPCIAPTSLWGYGWGSGVSWDAALFVVPWNIYRFTGDFSVIARYYPAMQKYLGFLETQSDNDIFFIGLGDWCAPMEAAPCDDRVILTCCAKHLFDLYAQMSSLLGQPEQEAYAKQRATQIKEAFQNTFVGKHPPCQTYYAALVYFDMTDEKQAAADTLAQLVRQAHGHIHAGILGAHMIPNVLRDYGHFDLAWEMVCKETYPGWLYMMQKCHGTMGEQWRGSASLDHHMFTAVDGFIQGSLSGLRTEQAEPGLQAIRLKPHFPKNVHNFSFHHLLPEGTLEIRWDDHSYCAVIPDGITGTVELNSNIFPLYAGKNIFSRI